MKSFENLYQENYGRVYNYIYGMTKNPSLAEDLTQEVFLIAFRKGSRFLKHENPAAFLYRTARLKTYEAMRDGAEHRTVALTNELVSDDPDLLTAILAEEDRNIDEREYVPQVMEQLNQEQRELYRCYYLEKKSMRQIAQEKDIKEAALKMRYVRLRKKVRKIIREMNMGNSF